MVFAAGAPASVKAVSVLVNDAACALLDQLGVSAESRTDAIVASDSSPGSLRETLVDAAARAALLPSRKPPTSIGSGSSWRD